MRAFDNDRYDHEQRLSAALAASAFSAAHGHSYRYRVPLLTRIKRQVRPKFIASLLASLGALLGHSATQAVQTHFESLNQLEQRLVRIERQLTALEHHANRREDNRP